jgi:hypothetical protein
MKTKILTLFTCMLLISLLITSNAMAQQPKYARPYNPTPEQMANRSAPGNYSFRLYTAPNNAVGYDILKDGKPVFHQFVLTYMSDDGKRSFAKKAHAEKAAALAIAKIKKGMPASLTEEEIRKIAAQ